MNIPSWSASPIEQLRRAQALWPGVELPEPPEFSYDSPTEVPLLHVPQEFGSLWNIIIDSAGLFIAKGWNQWRGDGHRWRRDEYERETFRPVWLLFDPSPTSLTEAQQRIKKGGRLAGSETLSALVQFPDLFVHWAKENTYPCFSGYEIKEGEKELGVWHPIIQQVIWDTDVGLLSLVVRSEREKPDPVSLFPVVREW